MNATASAHALPATDIPALVADAIEKYEAPARGRPDMDEIEAMCDEFTRSVDNIFLQAPKSDSDIKAIAELLKHCFLDPHQLDSAHAGTFLDMVIGHLGSRQSA